MMCSEYILKHEVLYDKCAGQAADRWSDGVRVDQLDRNTNESLAHQTAKSGDVIQVLWAVPAY